MQSMDDLTAAYRAMSDDQILELATEGGFTDDAKIVFESELSRRKITKDMVKSLQAEKSYYESSKIWTDPNINLFSYYWGIGFDVFGRNYLSDNDKVSNIQVRTKWFVFLHLPIIPIASFRYLNKESTMGMIQWKDRKLINQVPLNLKQVRKTWAITFTSLALAIGVFFLCLTLADRSHK